MESFKDVNNSIARHNVICIFLVVFSLFISAMYLSSIFIKKENDRSKINAQQIISSIEISYRYMTEEAFTGNYDSIFIRVKEAVAAFGNPEFQLSLLDNKNECLYSKKSNDILVNCIDMQSIKPKFIHLNENADYNPISKSYILNFPLILADTKIGKLNLSIQDKYEFYSGNKSSYFLIYLMPIFLILISVWLIWIYLGDKIFIKPAIRKVIELERKEVISFIAAQVAHDIRSPLAALGMITSDLDELEESKRIIIRGAVTRINDIANNLLIQNRSEQKAAEENDDLELILTSTLIDSIMTEKRMQFRDSIGIKINNNFESSSYGLFCEVHANELKRVCSNLLNNAVEILEKEGVVTVSLSKKDEKIRLVVQDNGKGISPDVLITLGKRGASHGKKEGNGLGLYHAISSVESWGGTLNVESTVGVGTSIVIDLPIAKAPNWFVPLIELKQDMQICILDDDESIHQVWGRRFSTLDLSGHNINLNHFSSPNEIIDWYKLNLDKTKGEHLFLMDYELLGHEKTGLDVIKKLNIAEFSYLVTSRFEDRKILEEIEKLNMGLIPKSMASEIPIILNEEQDQTHIKIDNDANKEVATILLDDDLLIHLIWEHSAKKNCINFHKFTMPDEIFNNLDNFSKESVFYIDSSLSDDIKGEDVAKKIFEMGFKNIHLATGYEADKFQGLDHIISVVGKGAPW